MKTRIKLPIKSILSLLLVFYFAANHAQNFENGNFEIAIDFPETAESWDISEGSPDLHTIPVLFDSFTFTAAGASPSPAGGNIISIYQDPLGFYTEGIQQEVSGFTIGETYTISYYEANFGPCSNVCYLTEGQINVIIDNTDTYTSGNLLEVDDNWKNGCVTFVAENTVHTIKFEAECLSALGAGSWMQLDNVVINEGSSGSNIDPIINYSSSVFCQDSDPDSPTIEGVQGGFFSSSPLGLDINSSTGEIVPISSEAGVYTIVYQPGNCFNSTSFELEILEVIPNADFEYPEHVLCTEAEIALPNFDTDNDGIANGTSGVFSSSDGILLIGTSGMIDPSQSEIGTYEITNTVSFGQCGSSTHTVSISIVNPPSIDLGNDTTFCSGSIILDAENSGAIYSWQDGSNDQFYTVNQSGNYVVDIELGTCIVSDTIEIEVGVLPVDLGDDFSTCSLDIQLDAGAEGTTYLWNDNSTAQFLNVTAFGIFSVEVFGNECNGYDEIEISAESLGLDLPEQSLACLNEVYTLDSNIDQADSYSWSQGGDESFIQVTENGLYSLEVTLGDCVETDQSEVIFYQPQALFEEESLTFCPPANIFIENLSSSNYSTITDWSWFLNESLISTNTNFSAQIGESGVYDLSLSVVDENQCSDEFTVLNLFEVFDTPEAEFSWSNEIPGILSPEVSFFNESLESQHYNWYLNDEIFSTEFDTEININNFNLLGESSFEICLETTNELDCSETTCHRLQLDSEIDIYIPNSFTPNNDYLNDLFGPVLYDFPIESYQLNVFNSWGELIFSSLNPEEHWNGKSKDSEYYSKDGIYQYSLMIKLKGQTEVKNYRGHVNLIR